MSQWYDLPVGIHVGGIVDGGPAEKAGMKVEDVIVSLNGVKIETINQLYNFLKDRKVGDKVEVIVVRNNKNITLNLTLGEMPSR